MTNDRNIGFSACLNKLCGLARGRYIAHMDSDDMCAPTRIEKQVAYLESHADVDVVGTAVLYIDRDNQPLGWRAVPADHEEICRHPSRTFGIAHGSILARHEWVERFPYDESLRVSVDANLWFRTHEMSTFGNLLEPLYYYRFEPSFTLRKQWKTRRASARYLLAEHRRAGRPVQGALHWGIQHAKFAVTALAFASGLRLRLMAHRFQPLSDEQKRTYKGDLNRIMARRDRVAPVGSA